MKKYIGLARNEFLSEVTYREHFLTSFLTETVFFVVLYFLWKVIYAASSGTIANMTFAQTYVSVALTACLVRCLSSGIEWEMHFQMIKGDIIIWMVKPVDYMYEMLWMKIGGTFTGLFTYMLPVFLIISLLFPGEIHFGFNILVFAVSLCISFFVMFTFEFLIGVFTFYTESVWGMSTIKSLIVGFFAGAEVPIAFFPDWLKRVTEVLPFQSLYGSPLQILTDGTLGNQDYVRFLAFQLLWGVLFWAAAKRMYRVMQKKMIVNGG